MALTREQMYGQFIKRCGKIQQMFNDGSDDKKIFEELCNPVYSNGEFEKEARFMDALNDNESLIISGTDIYKEPFTEEQLAILRGDSTYNKLSKDEFDALQAADYPKARAARKAWIKRARELLEGSGNTDNIM